MRTRFRRTHAGLCGAAMLVAACNLPRKGCDPECVAPRVCMRIETEGREFRCVVPCNDESTCTTGAECGCRGNFCTVVNADGEDVDANVRSTYCFE